MTWTGGCLCEEIRYEISADPIWVGICHCRWCQRHSGSAFLTLAMFQTDDVIWLKAKPAVFQSSPEVERGFCPRCGSTLTFARGGRNEMNVTAGSLDNPNVIQPMQHIFSEQKCAWLHLDDALPSYDRYPPGGEDREF
jgi:hypothetical protein